MRNRALIGIIIVAIVVVGGFLLLRGGYSQTSQPTTSTSQQSSMPMPMQSSEAGSAATSSAPSTGKDEVQIANYAFSPSTLTVKVGTSVTWTNQDSVGHSATSDDGTFDTGVLAQGKSGSFTFTKAGTYAYHCSVHPSMHGTIVVQ